MADAAAPKALAAERALLGGLLRDPRMMATMPPGLAADTFWDPRHGALYALLRDRWRSSLPTDQVTVEEAIARTGRHEVYGGIGYVMGLSTQTPSTTNLPHYAAAVVDAALRRRVQDRCRVALEEAVTCESGERLAATVAGELAALSTSGGSVAADHGADMVAHRDRLREEQHLEDAPGLSTGLVDLDAATGGLQPGELWVVAGRPGMGKSALAMGIGEAVLNQSHSVGLVSLEMKVGNIRSRRLAWRSGVPLGMLRDPRRLRGQREAWQRIDDAVADFAHLPLRIDDRVQLTVDQVRARAMQWHQQAPEGLPLGLLIVDYLQIMGGLGATSSERALLVGQAAQRLHDLAQDLDIAVVLVAQLNRGVESRQNKRPTMGDLRESGGIEQAANLILFPYRPNYYGVKAGERSTADRHGTEHDAEVAIGKQRDGAEGTVKVAFNGPCVRFFDNIGEVML